MYACVCLSSYVLCIAIECLHIHNNENKHKNNHGYGVKSAILLYKFQCMRMHAVIKSVKTPSYLIEVYGSTAF